MRQAQKLTQQEFADSLGVLISTISKYERGKVRPTTDFFSNLAETYNVNLNWLITGQGSMYMLNESASSSVQRHLEDAFNLSKEEAEILTSELMESPATRQAILKLLKAKRGNKEALEEFKGIIKGMELILEQ